MFRRLNYANVMATVALFFALSGGALAAKHYLINSTSQINPKVLKKLTGKTGPTGTQGKEGGPGREGSPGKEGPAGKEGKQGVTGPAGSAVAFARVEANGTLDATHSKNIAKAEMSVTAGVYCITPSVQVQSATVSEPHVGGDNGAYAQANIPATGDAATVFCSSPAWVATWKAGGTTLEAHPFYIVFN